MRWDLLEGALGGARLLRCAACVVPGLLNTVWPTTASASLAQLAAASRSDELKMPCLPRGRFLEFELGWPRMAFAPASLPREELVKTASRFLIVAPTQWGNAKHTGTFATMRSQLDRVYGLSTMLCIVCLRCERGGGEHTQ